MIQYLISVVFQELNDKVMSSTKYTHAELKATFNQELSGISSSLGAMHIPDDLRLKGNILFLY